MMQLFWSTTRGDPLYREVPFIDQYGDAVDLTGWGVQADFKRAYTDRKAYFSLTLVNNGLSFRDGDATDGVLCFSVGPDQFDDLALTVPPRNGERVPFKFIIGDLKLTPPQGISLVPDGGPRPSIVIKVLAGVTT